MNLTTATSLPQEGQGCTIRFPDNLRGRRVQITSGKNPKTIQVPWIPSGGGFQSSSPPVVHARVPSGSVVVQVDGLPAANLRDRQRSTQPFGDLGHLVHHQLDAVVFEVSIRVVSPAPQDAGHARVLGGKGIGPRIPHHPRSFNAKFSHGLVQHVGVGLAGHGGPRALHHREVLQKVQMQSSGMV